MDDPNYPTENQLTRVLESLATLFC